MRVISIKILKNFGEVHRDCEKQLSCIQNDLNGRFFKNSNEIKDFFPYISILKDNRIVMNICGNKYRLVLKINYNTQIAYVRFIGTHAEYSKIDANII